MNYVTWNTVVCGYPIMTSVGSGFLNSDSLDPPQRTISCVMKYYLRGFNTLDNCSDWKGSHTCGTSFYCPQTLRGVTDGGTMHVVFDVAEEGDPDLVDDCVVWRLATTGSCKLWGTEASEAGFVGNTHTAITSNVFSIFICGVVWADFFKLCSYGPQSRGRWIGDIYTAWRGNRIKRNTTSSYMYVMLIAVCLY